ncbi:MAG: hypothetical protein COA70_08540 [Planctomycetota bacterium]|nr:MAG: hypothetical protein COA70_08540 [Planctomycetota bacterium]
MGRQWRNWGLLQTTPANEDEEAISKIKARSLALASLDHQIFEHKFLCSVHCFFCVGFLTSRCRQTFIPHRFATLRLLNGEIVMPSP